MRVLGIETSCDETGAAVVTDAGLVLSDVVQSQIARHSPYGGIIPELASRDHAKNIVPVIRAALDNAGMQLSDIDGVAVTHRPGLVGALLVGLAFGKGLAFASDKPIVGVDHLVGHLLAVFLHRPVDRSAGTHSPPPFPFVALLASGGHTALYHVDGPRAEACRELGGTRDDAAGEAFDKVGKLLGLDYPGGPMIDKLAIQGDPDAFPLVAPMHHTRTLEFSFSGIKTRLARWVAANGIPDGKQLYDVCAAFQRAVVEVLVDKLFAAATRAGVGHVVLGGGVAANSALRGRVIEEASRRELVAHVPPRASCTDNAAMIAYAGAMRLAAGETDPWNLAATGQTSLARATRKGSGPR